MVQLNLSAGHRLSSLNVVIYFLESFLMVFCSFLARFSLYPQHYIETAVYEIKDIDYTFIY
ncbi:hypothetical protein DR864_08350 [Runella rosea]|uniref:Uncharacterized protein n=1 Tax=Runella rosea TaxID=2259595 RepID=A0A344TGH4_9BACT|nr:hypothetical protein DR864_08350 [Runella rosea]